MVTARPHVYVFLDSRTPNGLENVKLGERCLEISNTIANLQHICILATLDLLGV